MADISEYVRARIVKKPEDYRQSGIGYRIFMNMLGRIRYFSEGMVIGSKQFLKEAYAKFGGEIIGKKDRWIMGPGILFIPDFWYKQSVVEQIRISYYIGRSKEV